MAIFVTDVIMVTVMMVALMTEVANNQLRAVIKSPEHPPPQQDYPFLDTVPFVSLLFRLTLQAQHLEILVEESDPRETPSGSSPTPCCGSPAITVVVLCFVIIILRRYRHRIAAKARRMIRLYAMKKLKRILPRIPRSVKTNFLECSKEMKKSIVFGLKKAAANELLNLIINEIRQAAK